ncbi:cytochrome P450 [Longispora sp. NPDC051575]|uniref:cytochrome P450 family protein n=1 Tax=Longispora sp. NPDC051575 TaxID=3154943 RepID=UPI003421E17E
MTVEATAALGVWDTANPALRACPYPAYAALRAVAPVHRVDRPDAAPVWYVVGHAEARRALTDQRLVRDVTRLPEEGRPVEPLAALGLDRSMLGVDPPDHTRLRGLVSAAFTARRVGLLRPRVQEIADRLLDAMAGRDTVDLNEAYARPLPAIVICELLGVPVSDRDLFLGWIRDLFDHAGPRAAVRAAGRALSGYLADLVAAKRASPDQGLISALTTVRDERQRLTDAELLSTVTLLLVAGLETTVNLIGSATVALVRHPEQLAAVRADPALWPQAVEEVLRYDGPTEMAVARWAVEDLDLGGVPVPAGGEVLVVLGAANHDPALVPDADLLDVRRRPGPHLAFGHGVHHCLGAPLARIEAETALRSLFDRFPRLRLAVPAEDLRIVPNLSLRSLATLPVRLT